MPKISVVIPVYNGEKTIEETIASVLAQTFTDFELIVVNDGSQDKTQEIVQQFTDPRIKLHSYKNGGLATSRNRGIEKSQGEYISFLDADDLWTTDKLASQYQALQTHPQAAVAYSGTDWIDEFGNFLKNSSPPSISGDIYGVLLLSNIVGSGSNALIKKEALLITGNFDESLKASEDWDFLIRLAAKYEFIRVDAPQILYRQSPDSMSSKLNYQEQETVKVIRKAFRQAPPHLQYLKRISLSNTYIYLTYKSIEGLPSYQQGLKGLELFAKLLVNYPTILRYSMAWKILARIFFVMFLSRQKIQRILSRFPSLQTVHYFLNHIRHNP
jgi:glycosyltransferase involved in cell wall biosynthesis